MRTLGLPKRFPLLQNMKNSSILTWITWVRDENNNLIAAIDEEIARRRDPDDLFDGMASGIFAPLQHEDQTENQAGPQNKVEVNDEPRSSNPQAGGVHEGRLVDVQGQIQQWNQEQITTQRQETNSQPHSQEQQGAQQLDRVDTSTNQEDMDANQREIEVQNGQPPAQPSTPRLVEGVKQLHSQPASTHKQTVNEQTVQPLEDPFRTLRSFCEKQRIERLKENV